jgi:mannose-6-phosphate isomerase-like protein (cupin superfamily)
VRASLPFLTLLLVAGASPAHAQLPTVDVPMAQIREFVDALPRDAVSDRPIRVADAGSHHVAVYGVFRPRHLAGDAVMHEGVSNSEIYYMLRGEGTLVTGGTLVNPRRTDGSSLVRADAIQGGDARRIVPGDVVVIPPDVPHWWSELEGDVEYLIFRADPAKRIPLR